MNWSINTSSQEEDDEMIDDVVKSLNDNETVKFGAVIINYIGQQFSDCGKLIMGGGTGAWKGIICGIALLATVGLILYLGIAVFRGSVEGNFNGFNIPQIVAIAIVVFTVVSAMIPASATEVTDEYQTEVVEEGQ